MLRLCQMHVCSASWPSGSHALPLHADAGECDNNAPYMRGSNGSAGQCRKACGVCTPCKVGDAKCEEEARAAQGFLPNLSGELAELFPDNQ